jgi:hypothetical protein
MTPSWAARSTATKVDSKITAVTDGARNASVQLELAQRSSSLRRPSILMLMSFGKALFVAWCAWIGTLVAGSFVILLLDKPEWRVTVGMLSILVGILAFVYNRRSKRRVDG